MFEPRVLEKLIVWLVLIGFIAFSFGYVYAVVSLLQGCRLPLELWVVIIPLVLLLLAAFGLNIFRRVFIAKK
jgi:hypothetical protein